MQQVNLLSDDLIARREPLEAKHFVAIWALLLVLLAVVSIWQTASLWGLKSTVAEKQTEIKQLVTANAEQRATLTDPEVLRGQVNALQEEQISQGAIINMLEREHAQVGFGVYMRGLARARVADLWLTEIRLDHPPGLTEGKPRLTLKGETLDPRAVPKLLQNLAELEQFKGQRFRTLDMSTHPEENKIEFVITSPPIGAPG